MEFSTFLLIMIINVVWSVMFIWSGMRNSKLKEELNNALESSDVAHEAFLRQCREHVERAHEEAARAEEKVDQMQEEIHHLTADLDGREGEISVLGCEIAELERRLADNDFRSPRAYREDKKEWLDENKEHLRAEMKDLDSEEIRRKCEGMLVSALYWEDLFNWAHGEQRKAEHTLQNVGNILGDAGYPEKDELPF